MPAETQRPQKKILVIDDDKPLCKMMAHALGEAGYQTFTAFSGPEGLEIFKAELPDLALIDFAMPGMNGFEVVNEIRQLEKKDRRTLVVIITAYSQAFLVTLDFQVSIDSYLTKPLLLAELVARIDEMFESQSAS